jgi:pimeloyl-ACP methyl ester carboxylesterase
LFAAHAAFARGIKARQARRTPMTYSPLRTPRSETVRLRDLDFHLHIWPGTDPHPVLLLHGWGDTGETFQFLVDESSRERTFVAPDFRGFGRTQRPDDGYWFPDYLADLDALIDYLSPNDPVDVIAHSMGGNVAMLYAGARPERIRRLVNLEGLGLRRTDPANAPARYREWLDELKSGSYFLTYDSFETFATALAKRNQRTPRDRLEFIARSWGRVNGEGRVELWADPKHKRVNPVLYQRERAEACWAAIAAPILLVIGGQSPLGRHMTDDFSEARLQELLRNLRLERIAEAGHMLHHEQPVELARLIEDFLAAVL